MDIRENPIQAILDNCAWWDGFCLIRNSPVIEPGPGYAPSEAPGDRPADYYLWCSNKSCVKHLGECLGDMECPPDWATHEGRPVHDRVRPNATAFTSFELVAYLRTK